VRDTDAVLDLGSGSGKICYIAAQLLPALIRKAQAAVETEKARSSDEDGRPGYKCHPAAGHGTTDCMIDVLRFVVGLATDVVRHRIGLVAENALLRQQLIGAQRKLAGRVHWAPWQRFTMGLAARLAPGWRNAALLV
jgi:hypothetical protein